MPATTQLDPIWLSTFGVLATLLGLVWAVLGGRLRPAWRWQAALAAAALLGLAAAGAWARQWEAWLWQPLLAVMGVSLILAVASSPLLPHVARFLAILGRRPQVQALVLMAAGIALAGWQMWQMDSAFERDMNETEVHLTLLTDPSSLNLATARRARTDAGTAVALYSPQAISEDERSSVPEMRYLQQQHMELKVIQTAPPDPRYNCHGWVFAGGRYWVRSDAVNRVLADNRYDKVERPAAGDVAIFRNEKGEVTHSALVRSADEGAPVLLESKWGRLGRYVHTASDHAYCGHTVTYYRAQREGHLLCGTEGPQLEET
jgi:hypothetical protein